jgi:hypothetical protein
MTTNEKIEAIKDAINRANNLQSNMDAVAWSVPALSSLRIRHLMNNLGAISTKYLEIGVHKGGLFCSTIMNNPNIKLAFAIDNYASDVSNEDKAYPQFLDNVRHCRCGNTAFYHHVNDTFDTPVNVIYDEYDLYTYDAAHDYESQRKAMTHFLPAMADEFIVCVDDFDWMDVNRGTLDGIIEANVDILFQEAWKGNDHDNDGWWNGFYIALLKKK